MPNGKQCLLFLSLLSALLVTLAWRKICPGSIACDAAAECWAVLTMSAICTQIHVTAHVQQIYVLIACEWGVSHIVLCLVCAGDLIHPRYVGLGELSGMGVYFSNLFLSGRSWTRIRAKHFNWADFIRLLRCMRTKYRMEEALGIM